MRRVVVAPIRRFGSEGTSTDQDLVAVEAPLAIDLVSGTDRTAHSVGVLMRTPGDDLDLVRGWLRTERIIQSTADIRDVEWRVDADAPETPTLARVSLDAAIDLDAAVAHRTFTPTSACGLCGRLSVDRLETRVSVGPAASHRSPRWSTALIVGLPATLRAGQAVFAETGGLHAAGLIDDDGRLVLVREDVGRHNAVDKLIGATLEQPITASIVAVSGRVAFEIVQKAVVAGLEAIVAVGAPSDLAVDAARAAGLTLVGFVRDGRFNVYAGANRIGT